MADVVLHCVRGLFLPGSDMKEPPGKLVIKDNIDLCRMTSEITHLWACDKVIIPPAFMPRDI